MKLSDYVARFLQKQGIKHVFAVSGGASVHLIQSIADTEGITFVCPQHEQGGAMAADGYSRVTRNLGAAISTSGPGATNMLTGTCCAYYDSVPLLLITGQVATFRMKKDIGVRQIGFQETSTLEIFKSVTKYSTVIEDPLEIRYELEKACHIAKSGRPGPALIDIPDDIQRKKIDVDKLRGYQPDDDRALSSVDKDTYNAVVKMIETSKRPVLIVGWGIRLSKAENAIKLLMDRLNMPVLPTWGMVDFIAYDNPLLAGTFGTHGTRYGNFTVQNADLILSIGSKLDTHAAGSPFSHFARGAKKIIVDIDHNELLKFEKFGMKVDAAIVSDANQFAEKLLEALEDVSLPSFSEWKDTIALWKEKYPICDKRYYAESKVNPYVFVKSLSHALGEGEHIFVDTGCGIAWMMQAFEFKNNQRIYHDFNNTAMGYALPASIGASLALDKKRVICVMGDGSIQMTLPELATAKRHDLPIKIFLINNNGYSMIRQTQDQWLDSKYLASSVEGGLGFPDYSKIADAFGFGYIKISNNNMAGVISDVLKFKGPILCDIEMPPDQRIIPLVKFGRPLEDPEPFLPREEFLKNMIVEPL